MEVKVLIGNRIGQNTEIIKLAEEHESTFGSFVSGKPIGNKYEQLYFPLV
ncbi:hypothetical protein ACFQZJ_04155 [Maribacter chungangensis]|uniref:Uncharacterized protein n=1 Tax=Maribacter chungangensis TaxID=1069117 RepID=A0ABW3B0J4_9FLAO